MENKHEEPVKPNLDHDYEYAGKETTEQWVARMRRVYVGNAREGREEGIELIDGILKQYGHEVNEKVLQKIYDDLMVKTINRAGIERHNVDFGVKWEEISTGYCI